jgi:predicted nucleotidyltransferase
MLKNRVINLGVIKIVSQALGEMNERVAYVGGAIVSIYADDPAAEDVRPTKDIDLTLQIVSFKELAKIQEELANKGIYPAPDTNVACRFQYKDILIDVMSTQEIGWAPSDPWFEPGFNSTIIYEIDNNTSIRVFPVSYFLATKFSAFNERGDDPRTSKDFEDIIYVLDNRLNIVNEIIESPVEVKSYLKQELLKLLKDDMEEAILCHLNPYTAEDRKDLLKEKLSEMTVN